MIVEGQYNEKYRVRTEVDQVMNHHNTENYPYKYFNSMGNKHNKKNV